MNSEKSLVFPKNRRGLSSVVGTLFFTILMIAGFSVMSLALDAQTDIVTTQRIVSDIEIKKQQERYGVLASVDGNKFLNVNIDNLGQNPVEISSIWIINKTLADQPAKRFDVNYSDAFIPSGFIVDVLESRTLQMVDGTYDIKVISSYGTIKIVELTVENGGGSAGSGLRAELITDPPDVIIGQNVTLAMMVTNTGMDNIANVQPDPLSFTPTGSGAVIASSLHTPSSTNLNAGESVMFSWDYQVTGDSGDLLTFSSIARGDGATSNTVSDISILREPTDGGSGSGGEGEEVVIKDELYGKPEIFLTFPSPLGWNDNDRAIWGVNVANPTDQPIEVSRVVIVALPTASTSGAASFRENCDSAGSPFSPLTISPTPNKWSCPAGNQLQWEDVDNPQVIAPRSVFPFLVRIGSDNISSPTGDANNLPITASVFTTLGQFGKSGYISTMAEEEVALPNVFLSTDVTPSIPNDVISEIRGIIEGDTVTFNAAIADLDDGSDYKIYSGSRLIINIPKDWTFGSVTSHVGFNSPTIQPFPDGSAQIIGILSSDLTSGAKAIQFTATAPDVNSAKMYVMHILGDGTVKGKDSNDYSMGSISEAILQVCPSDTGCPT